MKQPSFTAAPIAGEPDNAFSLKSLFTGHRRSTRYYEARHRENALYLLWMEYTRFGVLLAYPCVLAEPDREAMFFDTSANPMAEENNAHFLARWDALDLPEKRDSLDIRSLKEKEFRELYRKYRSGGAG